MLQKEGRSEEHDELFSASCRMLNRWHCASMHWHPSKSYPSITDNDQNDQIIRICEALIRVLIA